MPIRPLHSLTSRFRGRWPLLFAIFSLPVGAADPRDFAVQVTAQVQTTPALITLRWPFGSFATGYTISRKLLSEATWIPLATLPGNAVTYTDQGVVAGAAYEYEIAQANSDGLNAYGYIDAGMEVPFPGARGRVILVMDRTFTSDLDAELAQLTSDLVGDGWTVLRHDVDRSAAPVDVKALITADYNADPANTIAVFLFGHVPVPYSGDLNPDQHANHLGAWPADLYYGDMDGTWTDDSVNDTSAEDPRNHNVPGDGKFDQSDIPGNVVLQVGRVDLSDLPAFSASTELDLLRQYLDKDHRFRHKLFDVARRGLIRDNFGEIDGDAPATDAWRAFPPFFGTDQIDVIGPGDFFPTLASGSYLWAYGCGGGEYYQADGVGSTTDFATQSPQSVFFILHGSYFGDWDSTDNFLRAALASSGDGLVAVWSGLPHWFLHPMALGETIGLVTVLSQNNRGLYKNQVNLSAGQVHIALMGDPTLRMHIVAPPANLSAVSDGNGSVFLNWSASPDSIQGYYVYRADTPSGPFARLTRSFISGSSYTDAQAPGGSSTYMVRAVKLETSASGSYYNPSQGVFATAQSSGGLPLPTIQIDAPNPSASETGPVDGAFVISRSGSTSSPVTVFFSIGGTAINGTDYESISDSIVIPQDSSSAWITIRPIPDNLVEGNETVTLTLSPSDAYLIGSTSSATVTIQDATVISPPTLSTLADLTISENTVSQPIPFSVSDPDTPLSSLVLSVSSSNPAVAGNLILAGTGANRTLTVIPATNQTGSATVTVTVSDGTTNVSQSFQLTVASADRISSILRQVNGSILLTFDANAGRQYAIQGSADLFTWTTIGSGVATTGGPLGFLDSQAQSHSCRFYRVQWQ